MLRLILRLRGTRGVVVFHTKNRKGRSRKGGQASSHKLNITNDSDDNFIGNSVGRNVMSSYNLPSFIPP